MHEKQTILTDVRGVCLSVCLSVTNALSDPGSASLCGWLKSAAARAVYAACRLHGVIQCTFCQMSLASCLNVISKIIFEKLPCNINLLILSLLGILQCMTGIALGV